MKTCQVMYSISLSNFYTRTWKGMGLLKYLSKNWIKYRLRDIDENFCLDYQNDYMERMVLLKYLKIYIVENNFVNNFESSK